jgi:ribonuclease HI
MTGDDRSLRARALHALAETLDVEQTLARVPGLTRDALKALLLEAVAHGEAPAVSGRARRVIVYSDGASRGNPGPSGAGALVTSPDGRVLSRASKFLGEMTNNMAEYTALLIGLKEAQKAGADDVTIRADSELLIEQLNGRYKVKKETLQILHGAAMDLLSSFKRWKASHIPREKNQEADRLANQAIDHHA